MAANTSYTHSPIYPQASTASTASTSATIATSNAAASAAAAANTVSSGYAHTTYTYQEKLPSTLKGSFRISTTEMSLLSDEQRGLLLRQRVVKSSVSYSHNDHIDTSIINWCVENCSDLWCYDEENETVSLLNKEDFTLLLIANPVDTI